MKVALFAFVLSISFISRAELKCPRILSGLLPLSQPSNRITDALYARYRPGSLSFVTADEAKLFQIEFGLTENQFMMELLAMSKTLATPRVSQKFRGAVAKTNGGDFILGGNIEFPGINPDNWIHSVYFVMAVAFIKNVEGIEKIAVTAMPCDSCLSMLSELRGGPDISILVPHHYPVKLKKLFYPSNYTETSFLYKTRKLLKFHTPRKTFDLAASKALLAAEISYPFPFRATGITLELEGGDLVEGSHIENNDFKRFSALNMALVKMYLLGHWDFTKIKRAVFVYEVKQQPFDYEIANLKSMLGSIAPVAPLEIVEAVSSE